MRSSYGRISIQRGGTMIVTKLDSSINIKDSSLKLNLTQNNSMETGSENAEEMTYILEKNQAAYQLLTKGDITGIKQMSFSVTKRPSTFAGISVGFGASSYFSPITEAFVVTDLNMISGIVADGIWVKNLDTVSDCTINVCLAGD
jgi:hypothetical protein